MRDLSLVTDALHDILANAITTSPVLAANPSLLPSIHVTCQHPQTPATSECELSLYLFHVSPDKHLANSFWSQANQSGAGGKQPVAFEPLSLDLWYMLSAQAPGSYVLEQQVLGIAMQAFHDNPIVRISTPTPLPNPVSPSEVTLTLETTTFDEMSRLWQALELPLRTTAQYRASVVFLTPDEIPAGAPEVKEFTLSAGPADPAADPSMPHLLGTRRTLTYTAPGPSTQIRHQTPATTAPTGSDAQSFWLDGLHLKDTDHVLLIDSLGSETDVTTTWKQPITPAYAPPGPPNGVPFLLRPPASSGVPQPGAYHLVVERPAAPPLPAFRSNAVVLLVAPFISPGANPLVTASGGIYTVNASDVPTSGVFLRMGTLALARVAAGSTPGPGEWQASGGTITFRAPAGTPPGTYEIGLRANEVEADPARWAVV